MHPNRTQKIDYKSAFWRISLPWNSCLSVCGCARELALVTPGPRLELWSHSRGPRTATRCTDLSAAHLCACGVCGDSAAGLMVWAIHLCGVPRGDHWLPAGELTSPPSHLQHSLTTDAIGNLYALSSSCQSWLTFSAVMEWVLKVLSLKSRLPHLILFTHTASVTILHSLSLLCLLTH